MTTRAAPPPMLTAALVRRRQRLRLAAPPAHAPVGAPPAPARGWSDDLRFFATCYAAGVAFFLIMLS